MVVASSTASDSVRSGPAGPIRTCIGCRSRAAAADLLRVAVAPEASGSGSTVPVVPDPRRRIAGRGAWLHLDPECVELAQRRRAFARALRDPGPLDLAAVVEYVAIRSSPSSTSGNPQE
jgi:predicted RNA-binding protein YlxR (DUF448 family)